MKIVGDGPALRSLKRLAGPTVAFLGRREGDALRTLYANASATLFVGDEDFGLVPIESMACGTPVVAYRGGGALETIIEGKTGCFFDVQTPESLSTILRTFDRARFDAGACRAQATRFSRGAFEKTIREEIGKAMK